MSIPRQLAGSFTFYPHSPPLLSSLPSWSTSFAKACISTPLSLRHSSPVHSTSLGLAPLYFSSLASAAPNHLFATPSCNPSSISGPPPPSSSSTRCTFPQSKPIITHSPSSSNRSPSSVSCALAALYTLTFSSSASLRIRTFPLSSSFLYNLLGIRLRLDKYLQLFDELPVRGVVAWSTLIAGLCRDGRPRDALLAFERMHFAGVEPNRITMVNTLAACAFHGAALDVGEWIHQRAVHAGWELDVVLGTALVDMYCKNGRINMAVELFSRMPQRNVFTWNSLILGYAFDKGGNEALQLFSRMEQEGVKPDTVTLIAVLAACGHSGLVEHGRRIFDAVVHGEFGFQAGIKHYGCMVDLYGRAGLLNEAVDCIEKMPFEPNVVIYGSLLAACRLRKEKGLSEFAARKLVELQPENAAHYVLLSNLYVEDGRWREAEEMRRLMKERGLRKDLGRACRVL
ncbi:hypothetical protein HPP92_016332 [Vanilla planifolia]|uniref:Pentatricopeptide repeat-containing protein n=1 Tax=Vanilla planifolia TaxID=51239 RepID=A0A835QEK2_VANPL|nr:hypothetical protein HPP92_016332 [Vanilla planifolia]